MLNGFGKASPSNPNVWAPKEGMQANAPRSPRQRPRSNRLLIIVGKISSDNGCNFAEHVTAATRPDDRRLPPRPQAICQCVRSHRGALEARVLAETAQLMEPNGGTQMSALGIELLPKTTAYKACVYFGLNIINLFEFIKRLVSTPTYQGHNRGWGARTPACVSLKGANVATRVAPRREQEGQTNGGGQ